MQLSVVAIHEKHFAVGEALLARSWQEAYDLAEEMVYRLYRTHKHIDVTCDADFLLHIQSDVQMCNYHMLWNTISEWKGDKRSLHTDGNHIAVQIVEIT